MTLLVCDPSLAHSLIAQRQNGGLDRFDEVWNGVYVMSPIADNEHQSLATKLSTVLTMLIDFRDLGQTVAGANVSDRPEDWTKNYRVPDVLVFLKGSEARNLHTHWFGGPDFAVEIVSRGDRTLEKLDFYAAVGVRELLVIDRYPWKLTLYRSGISGRLDLVGESQQRQLAESHVIPVAFALDAANETIHIYDDQGNLVRSIQTSLK